MFLLTDGVQTVGGDDNTAIAAANAAKAAGTKVVVVAFGDVSLVTISQMASWPASTYALYRDRAKDLSALITNGEFGACEIALDLPRGPPPSPPRPSPPPPPPSALPQRPWYASSLTLLGYYVPVARRPMSCVRFWTLQPHELHIGACSC